MFNATAVEKLKNIIFYPQFQTSKFTIFALFVSLFFFTTLAAQEIDISVNSNPVLSGSTVDFGSNSVGDQSSTTFSITNIGDSTLSLTSPLTISGPDAQDFTIRKQPKEQLKSGKSDDFSITFAPSSPGIKTAQLSIVSNDIDENPFILNLTGTGEMIYYTLSGTVTDGTNPVENATIAFSHDGHTESTAADGTYSYEVPEGTTTTITPSKTDYENWTPASITLENIAADSPDQNFQGTLITYPEMTVSQDGQILTSGGTRAFGSLFIGTSGDVLFTIENSGTADLTIFTPLVLTGHTDFYIISQPAETVSPSGNTIFTVRFFPTTDGEKTAQIQINSNDGTFILNLSGTGEMVYYTLSGTVTDGTNPVENASISFSHDGHTESTAADGTYSYEVPEGTTTTITPSKTDYENWTPASITLENIAADSPDQNFQGTLITYPVLNLSINGNGIVSGNGYDFGELETGTTADISFTITNTGNADLILTTPVTVTGADTGAFSIIVQPSELVEPGNAAIFTVRFAPLTQGVKNEQISIISNDSDQNPFLLNVTGIGISAAAPEIKLSQNGTVIQNSGNYPFGDTETLTHLEAVFSIENSGNGDLVLTAPVSITGPDAQAFSVESQPAGSIPPGGTADFTVRFMPLSAGTQTAEMHIESDDSDKNPYIIYLEGIGSSPDNPFGNSSRFYHLYSGNLGKLETSSNPYTYQTIKTSIPSLDAAGYNRQDGMVYAIMQGSRLVRLNDKGDVTVLSVAVPFASLAGDCDKNGHYYFVSTSGDQVARFDIHSGEIKTDNINGSFPVRDMVLIGSHFYGIHGRTLYQLNPSGYSTTSQSISGSLAGDAGQNGNTWGATWTASDGYLYVVNSAGHRFYKIDTRSGMSFYVGSGSGGLDIHDGFSSHTAGCPIPSNGSIGGRIWLDTNANGLQENNEPGVDNVSVILYHRNGQSVHKIISDSDGLYSFSGITAEQYYLEFTDLPANMQFTAQDAGDDQSDSDVNPEGQTAPFIVNLFENDATHDAGLVKTFPEINLSANGRIIQTGDTIAWDSLSAGSRADLTVSIENTGTGNLTIDTPDIISLSNADEFVLHSNPDGTILPGTVTSFVITFAPVSEGIKNAVLSIENNDIDENPFNIVLQGQATEIIAPEMDLLTGGQAIPSDADLDFGQILPGADTTITITVENNGNGDLWMTMPITITGENPEDFSINKQPGSKIKSGDSKDFRIYFHPRSSGLKTAQMSIENNDSNENPYVLNLAGSGAVVLHTISGYATDGASPVENVTVSFSHNGHAVQTDVGGYYTYAVEEGISTTITPYKTGYISWTPVSIVLDSILTDYPDQNFQGTIETHPILNLSHNDMPLSSEETFNMGTLEFEQDTSATFRIQNTGSAYLTLNTPLVLNGPTADDFFIEIQPEDTLYPGKFAILKIGLTPASSGEKTARIEISSNDANNNPFILNLTATVNQKPAPDMLILHNSIPFSSGDIIDFGSLEILKDTTFTIGIQNQGNADLIINLPLVPSGADANAFTIESQPDSIIGSEEISYFTVQYNPQTAGTKKAGLSIENNDAKNNPFDIIFHAAAVPMPVPSLTLLQDDTVISSDAIFDFGTHFTGTDTSIVFSIQNTGTGRLILESPPAVSGPDAGVFSITEQPELTIDPGSVSRFIIRYAPASEGSKSEVLTINSNDSDNTPFIMNLHGDARKAPDVRLNQDGMLLPSGSEFDFGTCVIGKTDTTFSFTLDNTDAQAFRLNTPLAITGPNSDEFVITRQPEPRIDSGSSLDFSIQFVPASPGEKTAYIQLYIQPIGPAPVSSQKNSAASQGVNQLMDITGLPIDIVLSAMGMEHDPEILISGNGNEIINGDNTPSTTDGTDFGNVDTLATSGSQTFYIENEGTTDLGLTGTPRVVITGTHSSDFSVTLQPSSPIAPGSSVPFTIEFDPSAMGLRTAIINIANDDDDEDPYTFYIQGTGTVAPVIDVKGNSTSIANGDNTPSPDDSTYFGDVDMNDGTRTVTFTIDNIGSTDLNLTGSPYVTILGDDASDFTVVQQPGTPVSQGGNATFIIEFDPPMIGLRNATVSITSDDSDESPYLFAIQGNGTGPGAPIACVPNFFHIMDTDGKITYLNAYTNPYTYTTISTAGYHVNAAGYNYEDGLIYAHELSWGISGNNILRIDATGGIAMLATSPPFASVRGDCDLSGNYYFINHAGTQVAYYDISADVMSAAIPLSGGTYSALDIAYMAADGRFYGVSEKTLYIYNPSGHTVSTMAITGRLADDYDGGINGSAWGATWTAVDGYVYVGNNDSGRLYKINRTTGASVYIGTGQGNLSANDGASCPLAAAPLPSSGRLGDLVWIDYNNNGIQDSGERGMSGITVSLYISDGTFVTSTTTASDGSYLFENLAPAEYYMIFSNLPSGFSFASQDQGSNDAADSDVNPATGQTPNITISVGVIEDQWDAGIITTGIGDRVWYDSDHDGIQDAGETEGVQGVTVQVEYQTTGTIVATTTTDADGYYYFGGLVAGGQYVVIFSGLPGGYVIGPRNRGWNDNNDSDPRNTNGRTSSYTMTNNIFDPSCDASVYQTSYPEIRIRGNGNTIPDGDTTPSATDDTDFGNVLVASGSVDHTFTIQNTGSADLTLNGSPIVEITGPHASDFTVIVDPATPISGGSSTTFQVRFDPVAGGLREATISISNNDSNEDPYDFTIQGTGLAPEMDVLGNDISIADSDSTPDTADDTDFGSADIVTQTVSHTFKIKNLGSADLNLTDATPYISIGGTHSSDFSITAVPTTPISAGDSTTFTIEFDPAAVGLRTATISIANNDLDENPYTFDIQGTGTAAPEMDVQGNGNSIINGDATPSTTDDTEFGSADILYDTPVHTFTIENSGSAELNLTGVPIVAIGGANAGDFLVNQQPASSTISPSNTVTFQVTFDPTTTGLRQAVVSISNNDSNENPYTFTIQGTGTEYIEMDVLGNDISIPNGDSSPQSADNTDFGSTEVSGSVIVKPFKIKNLGSALLELTDPSPYISITGTHASEFTLTLIPEDSIYAGGDSTLFEITFDPDGTGLRSATISIANTDSDENPYTFDIQGTGDPDPLPELTLNKSVDKPTAVPGEVLSYTIIYSNIGTGNANNIIITESIPTNSTYVTGSAGGAGMVIQYSHDGGFNYDSSEAAPVTDIMYSRSTPLAPGNSGSITLQVTVD